MAILNLTIDTKTYECKAEINGETVPNLDSVSVYNYGDSDRPRYTFSMTSYYNVGDARVCTTVSASAQANASVSSIAPDLFETKSIQASQAQAELADFYSKRNH